MWQVLIAGLAAFAATLMVPAVLPLWIALALFLTGAGVTQARQAHRQ